MKQRIIEALQGLRDNYRKEANRFTIGSTLYMKQHDEANAVQAAINVVNGMEDANMKDTVTIFHTGELDLFRHEIERGERNRIINIIRNRRAPDATAAEFRDYLVSLIRSDGVETEPGHLNKVDPHIADTLTPYAAATLYNELVDAVEALRQAWSRRFEP